jgi:hypothetical protein
MNIFALDIDPAKAAQYQCEQHLRSKMLAETAQLLQNAFPKERLMAPDCPRNASGEVRGQSHYNHPCSKWVRQSRGNFNWLVEHGLALEQERMRRGYNPHLSRLFVEWAAKNIDESVCPSGSFTDFCTAISEDKLCRKDARFNSADSVLKYRLYYKLDKPFATWKNGPPDWFNKL